jgi:hypothetical protein
MKYAILKSLYMAFITFGSPLLMAFLISVLLQWISI